MEADGPLLILAHGGSWDRRFQVSSLAASEAATGRRVDVALFFAALNAWIADWDASDPDPPVSAARLLELDLPPLSSMITAARNEGLVRIYACSASLRILGLDVEQVQNRVDAILGWQSFSRMIAASHSVVTF